MEIKTSFKINDNWGPQFFVKLKMSGRSLLQKNLYFENRSESLIHLMSFRIRLENIQITIIALLICMLYSLLKIWLLGLKKVNMIMLIRHSDLNKFGYFAISDYALHCANHLCTIFSWLQDIIVTRRVIVQLNSNINDGDRAWNFCK